MTTSDVSNFSIAVWEIVDEAFERIGQNVGALSAYDSKTARRSLNLMLQSWINNSVNLWTIEQMSLNLYEGQASYELDEDTLDILPETAMIRNYQAGIDPLDIICNRIMRDEYQAIPTKDLQARPIQYLLELNRDAPQITFWPIPDISYTGAAGYQLIYYRVRYMQDVDTASETLDVPRKFFPAAVAGLAAALAKKAKYQVDQATRMEIENDYMKELSAATFNDRDKTSVYLVPDFKSGARGRR